MPENLDQNDPAPQLLDAEAHTVTTPLGILKIWFPEEGGTVVHGDSDAVDCLNDALLQFTGRLGQSLRLDGIEPIELEQFFDGTAHHITVIPPFDSLMDSTQEELASNVPQDGQN